MSDETNLYFNLDDEDNEKRVVVRVSELVRCLKHFRESLLCNGGDYEHDMREIGGHLKAATLGGGTLTVEQVRETIKRHSTELLGGHRVFIESDWQAIADELNSRAERTCEPKWTLQGETQTQEFWRCQCGNCGHEFGVEDRSSFPFKMTIDKVDVPNYCPNCGSRVVA